MQILFVLFGDVDDILMAFPVVAALREKHRTAEIVWLTSAKHASLARASFVDGVCEFEPIGAIPWDWVALEGFTHVFNPVPAAMAESLHPIDSMAKKCGVKLDSRKAWLEPGPAALLEAESFLTHCALSRKSYLTVYHAGELRRLWPSHNLHKLATAIGLPVVVIGDAGEFATAGTIPCFGRSPRVVAALIRWSAFYMGPDFGVSWIALTTGTPMGIFIDSTKESRLWRFRGNPQCGKGRCHRVDFSNEHGIHYRTYCIEAAGDPIFYGWKQLLRCPAGLA